MKKQARKPRPPQAAVAAKISLPTLKKGEIYVGGTIDVDGKVTHTILLPKEKEVPNWQAGMTFAKTEGGDLPNRIEQAMLWAHHADKFQKRYYWSNAQYAGNVAYAWYQSFNYGDQYYWHKDNKTMARAVRRVTI
jgi:hypothetical protein